MNEETKPATIKELCEMESITAKVLFEHYKREETKRELGAYSSPETSVYYRAQYQVKISAFGREETFGYFTGHSSEREFYRMSEYDKEQTRKKRIPKLSEVLWSLAQDASFFVNNTALDATYENFASEYGYDEDSRKGLEIYQACQANGNRLQKLLGREAFSELMALVNEGIEE